MRKYICDKCKKETKSYDLISLETYDVRMPKYDLCEKCFNEVNKFIKEDMWCTSMPQEKKKWWQRR